MKLTKKLAFLAAVGLLAVAPGFANSKDQSAVPVDQATLEKSVNHALQTLAYYGVFDDLNYRVDAKTRNVTLFGQVARPVVSRNAESAVKHLAGVQHVDNQVEVLPLSSFDDDIRIRAYLAIYGYPALNRYAINSRPTIHILVKNGNLTLTGVVDNELDRKLAEMRVRTLPFTFQVTNDLRIPSKLG